MPSASWLNITSIAIGVLMVATCAYIAAVFLVSDARRAGDAELERYFRSPGARRGGGRRSAGARRADRAPSDEAPVLFDDLMGEGAAARDPVGRLRGRGAGAAGALGAAAAARAGGGRAGGGHLGLGRGPAARPPPRRADDRPGRRAVRDAGVADGRVRRRGAVSSSPRSRCCSRSTRRLCWRRTRSPEWRTQPGPTAPAESPTGQCPSSKSRKG